MIRFEVIPRSIASLARSGSASTAKRRRSAGFLSLRRIAEWIARRAGDRRGKVVGRNGGCSERASVPGGGVRRRGACVPGDRAGAGAPGARTRGARGDLGALAG